MIIIVSRVDALILGGQLKQPTLGAVGRARLSVSTSIGTVVVLIELRYRLARLLSRTAEVLHHQGSERKRPPKGVRVSPTGVFASPDYVRLIGNTRPNADVIHAVIDDDPANPVNGTGTPAPATGPLPMSE